MKDVIQSASAMISMAQPYPYSYSLWSGSYTEAEEFQLQLTSNCLARDSSGNGVMIGPCAYQLHIMKDMWQTKRHANDNSGLVVHFLLFFFVKLGRDRGIGLLTLFFLCFPALVFTLSLYMFDIDVGHNVESMLNKSTASTMAQSYSLCLLILIVAGGSSKLETQTEFQANFKKIGYQKQWYWSDDRSMQLLIA
jgi:hypothetical protein